MAMPGGSAIAQPAIIIDQGAMRIVGRIAGPLAAVVLTENTDSTFTNQLDQKTAWTMDFDQEKMADDQLVVDDIKVLA